MTLANKKMRSRIADILTRCLADDHVSAEFKEAAQQWLDGKDKAAESKAAAERLKPLIEAGKQEGCPHLRTTQRVEPLPHQALAVDHRW